MEPMLRMKKIETKIENEILSIIKKHGINIKNVTSPRPERPKSHSW